MDGNGRWAKKRFMPRFFGHKEGVDALVKTVLACADRGVEYLTVFAFSSENWKRPTEEVSGLMGLVLVAVAKYLTKLSAHGVRIRIVGDRSARSRTSCARPGSRPSRSTRDNQAHHAVGGVQLRRPLGRACRPAGARSHAGIEPEHLDEAALGRYMALSHAPDPDLFIRTGGELRISNFLLWQAAYSELVFTDCLWPDFDEAELDAALREYARPRPALRPREGAGASRARAADDAQAARHHGAGAAGAAAAGAVRSRRRGPSRC